MQKAFEEAKELKSKGEDVGNRWSIAYSIKSKLERTSLNYPIQGTAANQTKLAGIKFRNSTKNSPIRLILAVHDEMGASTPIELADEAKIKLETAMIDGGNAFVNHLKMEAGAMISTKWQH